MPKTSLKVYLTGVTTLVSRFTHVRLRSFLRKSVGQFIKFLIGMQTREHCNEATMNDMDMRHSGIFLNKSQ